MSEVVTFLQNLHNSVYLEISNISSTQTKNALIRELLLKRRHWLNHHHHHPNDALIKYTKYIRIMSFINLLYILLTLLLFFLYFNIIEINFTKQIIKNHNRKSIEDFHIIIIYIHNNI